MEKNKIIEGLKISAVVLTGVGAGIASFPIVVTGLAALGIAGCGIYTAGTAATGAATAATAATATTAATVAGTVIVTKTGATIAAITSTAVAVGVGNGTNIILDGIHQTAISANDKFHTALEEYKTSKFTILKKENSELREKLNNLSLQFDQLKADLTD